MLDFFFTQRELKILDDVFPEHRRKELEDNKKDDDNEELIKPPGASAIHSSGSSGNVVIPLANGNILKITMDKLEHEQPSMNITEQLAKSGAWKTIDQKNSKSLHPETAAEK